MILVTGGTGNIGKDVVQGLAARGAKTRVLARDPAKVPSLAGVETVHGDLSRAETLDAAMKGVDTVFLLVAAGPEPDMVAQHVNAVAAAKRAGVKRIVKLSVLGADAKSPVSLARAHAAGEASIRESGLAWTMLQPHYFLQNTFAWAPTVKGDGAFYGAMKDGKISWVDTRDIADVAVQVLTAAGSYDGRTLVITGPEAISHADAAAKITAAIGRRVAYVDVPPESFGAALTGAGLPKWLADDFVALHSFFATGAAAGVAPTVKEITGKPGRRFDDFLRDYAASFK